MFEVDPCILNVASVGFDEEFSKAAMTTGECSYIRSNFETVEGIHELTPRTAATTAVTADVTTNGNATIADVKMNLGAIEFVIEVKTK